jgi:hypothetical protein
MVYKKIGPIRRVWYSIKYAIQSWIEWQDAKDWANQYHPAWVEIAKRARHEETRKEYKRKILLAYRGYEYV